MSRRSNVTVFWAGFRRDLQRSPVGSSKLYQSFVIFQRFCLIFWKKITMSCDTEMFLVKESSRCAVVFTLSKAHSCLELHRDKERNHVTGSPFRLLRKSGIIWKNFDLRKAGIAEGSIIVVDQNGEFVNSTKEKMVSFSIWYGSLVWCGKSVNTFDRVDLSHFCRT